jgi:ketosteroid isomerase-like protein
MPEKTSTISAQIFYGTSLMFRLEETMKTRLFFAVAAMAIGFALLTFAQQTSTPDPQLREQMLAFAKKYDQIWNDNDAAALAALFTDDAIEVTNTGPIYGRKALEKNWGDLFQKIHFSDHVSTVDQYSPHAIGNAGKEVWMNGEYSMTLKGQNFGPIEQKGYWCLILVRDGDAWKPRLQIWNIAQPPTPPAETNASPTAAQEQSKVDPEVRQQIEALFTKVQEAYNSRDTAAIAGILTADAIQVRSWAASRNGGTRSGRQAIEKMFETDFAGNPGKMVNRLVALYPIGSAVCEIADSNVGRWKAQEVTIYVREGDTWKARITYLNNEQQIQVDPQVRQQQVEAPFIKFQEAFNNRDVAAIGALLTQDAIEVRSWPVEQNGGLFSGREAQEKMFQTDFVTNPPKMVNKVVALYPIGSAMCEIGHSQVGSYENQTVTIYVREGDIWKRCMSYIAPL